MMIKLNDELSKAIKEASLQDRRSTVMTVTMILEKHFTDQGVKLEEYRPRTGRPRTPPTKKGK